MTQHKSKCCTVPLFHLACYGRIAGGTLFVFYLFFAQQVGAQYRCHRQCHNRRSCQCHDEGNAQRYKHTAFHAAQEKQRNEAYHDNERGVQDRHTHFFGSVEYDFQYRQAFRFRFHPVLPQAFVHVLHIDNGIVHQRTDGDSHTAEAHCVDGESHIVQRQQRSYQRQGKRHQ